MIAGPENGAGTTSSRTPRRRLMMASWTTSSCATKVRDADASAKNPDAGTRWRAGAHTADALIGCTARLPPFTCFIPPMPSVARMRRFAGRAAPPAERAERPPPRTCAWRGFLHGPPRRAGQPRFTPRLPALTPHPVRRADASPWGADRRRPWTPRHCSATNVRGERPLLLTVGVNIAAPLADGSRQSGQNGGRGGGGLYR